MWISLNIIALRLRRDPYPFILLTLAWGRGGGRVIERAAIMAEGANCAAILSVSPPGDGG